MSDGLDWGDGDYALTAAALLPAAEVLVEAAGVASGDRVLDVACGTGNVALSAFGVIFSPAPDRAAAELLRVVRPGGRVAITTWGPEGAIFSAGALLAAEVFPPREDPPRWGEAGWVRDLFERNGSGPVEVRDASLPFTAASAAAWFAEQEDHHPVWRWGRRQLGEDRWADLRERSVAVLEAGNEDPSSFRTTSRYLVALTSSAVEDA